MSITPELRKKTTFKHLILNKKKILKQSSTDQVPTKLRPSTRQVPANYPPSSVVLPQYFRSTSVEVRNLLKVLEGEMSRKEIQQALELKHEGNFRENYLEPALTGAVIEMKYPDSPNHPKQKYLVTEKGSEMRNILFR